jgi:hypothetical protein
MGVAFHEVSQTIESRLRVGFSVGVNADIVKRKRNHIGQ